MLYPLPALACLLLVFGLSTVAPAQTWQMPNSDLGVPKPQAPRIPTPGQFVDERDARIRARNAASIEADLQQYADQQAQRDQLLDEARQDIAQIERQRREQAEFNARFEASNKILYDAAYEALAEMLDGRRKANLPLAVFIVENTFTNNELNYTAFKAQLDELVQMCQSLAGAKDSPAARFVALQQLMTDTVRVSYAGKVVSKHLPYRYDFVDFWGKDDYTKQFVTKLLRTNTGQCHSMPLLYKLLADRLGIKSSLSMAPNHSYIQVVGPDRQLYSYETTNGHFTTDAFYTTSGFVKTAALKTRAYMDTLTFRQTLAYQVTDLAQGYSHYYGEDAFTEKCARLALKYYHQSVSAHIILHNAALTRFARAYKTAGSPTKEQAQQLPALKPLWAEVVHSNQALAAIGYEEISPEQYARWLNSAQDEQHRQESLQTAAGFLKPAAK
jgi:phosphoglycolate phosphatase-like HAD superfamily hydrolase